MVPVWRGDHLLSVLVDQGAALGQKSYGRVLGSSPGQPSPEKSTRGGESGGPSLASSVVSSGTS